MRPCTAPIVALAALLTAYTADAASTWIVDAGGVADFVTIQNAIDGSLPGDQILVNPGSYVGFDLTKGVVIRSNGSPTFEITGPVVIHDIPLGERCIVSGANILDTTMFLENNPGQVLLERIVMERISQETFLAVNTSDNVLISDMIVGGFRPFATGTPAVSVSASSIRLEDLDITGEGGGNFSTAGDAIHLVNSLVEISNPRNIQGGQGGTGTCSLCGLNDCCSNGDGTPGGNGIFALDSEVLISGVISDEIRGGQGGSYTGDGFSCLTCTEPDEPDGIGVSSINSTVTISRVTVSSGGFISDDTLPILSMTRDLTLSKPVTMSIDAVNPGFVIILWSDIIGWLNLAAWEGHKISAIPGGLFFLIQTAGSTNASGDLDILWTVSNDPVWVGVPLVSQAAVFESGGRNVVSNPVIRVFGL